MQVGESFNQRIRIIRTKMDFNQAPIKTAINIDLWPWIVFRGNDDIYRMN